ncbi:MAG: hypothetical protein M3Y54_10310, partial [Bacteroidota bacterium]|nr:hypothetical protein [Bacteroidota bacterium]
MKLPLLFVAACWGLLLSTRAQAQATSATTLEFVENRGQWDARTRYAAAGPGGRLFAEADGLLLSLLAEGGPAQLGHG